MGWSRQQFRAMQKPAQPARLRHARLPFHTAHCADCGRELAATHLVALFGERCKGCFEAFWQGAAISMARHEQV